MREFFEHLKDQRGMEITVCSLMEEFPIEESNALDVTSAEHIVAQGIAIQNPLDQYSRRRGNMIARGRAHKAHRKGESSNRLSSRMLVNLAPLRLNIKYKCYSVEADVAKVIMEVKE
ncbi:MAG: hypothetical protein ACWGQW_00485 [bacterium]